MSIVSKDPDHRINGFLDELNFSLTDEWIQEENLRKAAFSKLGDNIFKNQKKLKLTARMGIPATMRQDVWLMASNGKQLIDELGNVYENALSLVNRQLKSNKVHEHSLEDLFSGSAYIIKFLPEKIQPLVKEFLRAIWATNKGIEYFPFLPVIAVILLLFMEPPAAYASLQAMIRRSQEDSWYFTLNRKNYYKNVVAIEKLLNIKTPDVVSKAKSLGVGIDFLILALLPSFFIPISQLPIALTFFDSFIVEGRKVLLRFITTIFKINSDILLKSNSPKEFVTIILDTFSGFSKPQNLRTFLKESFSIYMSRKKHLFGLERIETDNNKISETIKNTKMIASIFNDQIRGDFNPLDFPRKLNLNVLSDLANIIPSEEIVKYQKNVQRKFNEIEIIHEGRLLDTKNYFVIKEYIPFIYLRQNPSLSYSLSKDGTILQTLLNEMKKKGAHILIIKTDKSIIGAFLSDQLEKTGSVYSRNTSNFVFHIKDSTMKCYKHPRPPNKDYLSVDDDTIMIGGPNPAIIIGDRLDKVRSCKCDTFDSPQLTLESSENILDVELYILEN